MPCATPAVFAVTEISSAPSPEPAHSCGLAVSQLAFETTLYRAVPVVSWASRSVCGPGSDPVGDTNVSAGGRAATIPLRRTSAESVPSICAPACGTARPMK